MKFPKRLFPLFAAAALLPAISEAAPPTEIFNKYGCAGCHAIDHKVVGPAFADVAAKYKDLKDPKAHFAERIHNGGVGTWGQIPMPPMAAVSDAELDQIVAWLMSGAKP